MRPAVLLFVLAIVRAATVSPGPLIVNTPPPPVIVGGASEVPDQINTSDVAGALAPPTPASSPGGEASPHTQMHEFERRQVSTATETCSDVRLFLPTYAVLCSFTRPLFCVVNVLGAGEALYRLVVGLVGNAPILEACLCLKNGQLTAASNATIDAALAAQTGSLAILVRELGSGDTALIVRALAPREIRRDNCIYPANSIPTCSASTPRTCFFICETNFERCGNRCIPLGSPCSTINIGGNGRRRGLGGDLNCDVGLTSCPVIGRKSKFECINIQTDIESCGGCIGIVARPGDMDTPLRRGRDCTELPHAFGADCVRGECVATSCRRGYGLSGGKCWPKVETPAGSQETAQADAADREAERRRDALAHQEKLDAERSRKAFGKRVLKSRQTDGRRIEALAKGERDDRLNARRGMMFKAGRR